MNSTGVADVYIEGEISEDEVHDGDISAISFRQILSNLGSIKELNLHINSPGGDVFQGIAIYNMLKQCKAKINVYIDGLAASIASVIAMSGDTIFMPKNAMMMIHNPMAGMVYGNAQELRKQADDLDRITQSSITTYLDKAGDKLDEDTLKKLMDSETWLTADHALEYGLCDEIIDSSEMVAKLDPKLFKQFHKIPKQLIAQEAKKKPKAQVDELKQLVQESKLQATILDDKLNILREDIINNGLI